MSRKLKAAALALTMLAGLVVPAFATGVRITVDGTPITDIQIQQRAILVGLEGHKSNQTSIARDQLINEALELEEAKRLKIEISDGQVDDAFLSVARNLKMSTARLTDILNGAGIGVATLRNRLKATLAWNEVTRMVIVPRVQISDLELEKAAESKLNATNSYDYVLKQVTFLSGKGSPGARMGQAQAYRAHFKGCDDAVNESLKYTDAAVTDVGRRNATQLPEELAKELAQLKVGGITRPRAVTGGVMMLAVCSKEAARDTTFLKNQLRNSQGDAALKAEQDKYLAELRAKATIVTK